MSDQPRTRVLFVHHRGELGGAPSSLALLIGSLDPSRFDAHVYCPPGKAAGLFRSAGAVVHTGPTAGFTHIWASSYQGARWLLLGRELLRLPGHLAALQRTIRGGQFDIVHLNDSPLIPAAWLAHRHRIPVVWHLRSAPANDGLDVRSRLVRRALLRFSRLRIAINREVADGWRVPASIVPNAVDTGRFSPGDRGAARHELGLPAGGTIVTSIGFLYPAKGFRELIEAAGLLRAQGYDATFLLVGGGVRDAAFFRSRRGRLAARLRLTHDHESEARLLVARLGIEDIVSLAGFSDNAPMLYRASDIIVAPSQGPEIGRPLLEAAATGVAAVATGSTTGGGVLEPDVTTVFARGRSAEAIAAALASLLDDRSRRDAIGAAAHAHALSMFDPERSAQAVVAAYMTLLSPAALADPDGERRSSGL